MKRIWDYGESTSKVLVFTSAGEDVGMRHHPINTVTVFAVVALVCGMLDSASQACDYPALSARKADLSFGFDVDSALVSPWTGDLPSAVTTSTTAWKSLWNGYAGLKGLTASAGFGTIRLNRPGIPGGSIL